MAYIQSPPDYPQLFSELPNEDLARVLRAAVTDSEYLHWDQVRRRQPPADLTHEEWWLRLKFGRQAALRSFPLPDAAGRRFGFAVPDRVSELLHFADRHLAGEIAMEEVVVADEQARRRYLVNSLMEEAIRSSQLEGATTSRRVAKQLLQTRREPADRSEQMILNNYRAMMFMRDAGDRLTPDVVLQLHRIVTEGTLDNPDGAGRLQLPGEDRVVVHDREGGRIVHEPPPADQLPNRLAALCEFANDRSGAGGFVHPVVRAVLLHFWLAYDHPFEDGNGRTARALFYWSMRTQGYWLAEYLSISRILRQAPARYMQAFQYTETDERDATYFLLYQLEVLLRATKELHEYLRRKVAEVREVESLLKADIAVNQRQVALLGHALRSPDAIYTFGAHASTHGVTHETARSDLTGLERRGLLERHRRGREYRFTAPSDLSDRLRALSG
jgi:Fic family protein